ncbi:hypothetical protein FRC17_004660, partial [Serendipita sp. 399]
MDDRRISVLDSIRAMHSTLCRFWTGPSSRERREILLQHAVLCIVLSLETRSPRNGPFVAYVFFACVMSIYTTSWDLLMDWSLLKPGARYPLLRKELMYSNQIWFYYFAIITNTIIRFGWIVYLPKAGPSPNVRGGIYGIVEA